MSATEKIEGRDNLLASLTAVTLLLADQSVLEGRVLLAAARVVHWQVAHLTQKDVNTDGQSDSQDFYLPVPPDEVGRLAVDVQGWHHFIAFKPKIPSLGTCLENITGGWNLTRITTTILLKIDFTSFCCERARI